METSLTVVDGVVIFGSREDHVFVLDAASGKKRWRFHVKQPVSSSPTVADGVVHFGTRTLDSNQKALYSLDAASGKRRKLCDVGSTVSFSPVVVDGVVYVSSDDGYLYALKVPE